MVTRSERRELREISERMGEIYEYFTLVRKVLLDELIRKVSETGIMGLLGRVGKGDPSGADGVSRAELRRRLMEKGMREGLSEEEARRLREILEEEVMEARAQGLIGGAVAIGLLILIGIIVASLMWGARRSKRGTR